MLKIGAHVSISGGIEKSIDREISVGGNCGQIFTHSPRGWSFDVPSNEECNKFRAKYEEENVEPMVIHEGYLPNLATPKEDLYSKSMEATKKEVLVAKKLGLEYINIHPGTHTGYGPDNGLNQIINSLNKLETNEEIEILLETTAGSGTTLGHTFDQIAKIIEETEIRTGVTLDTCHTFAAGYDLSTPDGLDRTLEEFDEKIGLSNLKLIHLNDSKHPLGSNKDRHEHIGLGEIGEDGMSNIINDNRLCDLPFVLETPNNDRRSDEGNIKKVKELWGS